MKTRKSSVKVTLDLGRFGEHDAIISYQYWPGHPGTWYRRNGDPGDPPEPAELEVEDIEFCAFPKESIIDFFCSTLSEADWLMELAHEEYCAVNEARERSRDGP